MTNGNDAANPIVNNHGVTLNKGLTKLEYFTAAARKDLTLFNDLQYCRQKIGKKWWENCAKKRYASDLHPRRVSVLANALYKGIRKSPVNN